MLDLPQLAHRLVADPLRGAVGRDQLGMGRFKLLEPLHELVVFAVADLRRGGDVVQIVVTADFLAKRGDLGSWGLGHGSGPWEMREVGERGWRRGKIRNSKLEIRNKF